ncbi:FHA domain-containing protein [Petralouisia muris]|uniref:FHA domain-containing protein n=1 Tax=Petralouisia muris TaxID=3032872 RepID=A0AC61S1A7_9FIRM|nr:FHA domain-containing protein [Petralouisia muris]TGY97785.1 FHA domain-containing protein [Petralouisia muris]
MGKEEVSSFRVCVLKRSKCMAAHMFSLVFAACLCLGWSPQILAADIDSQIGEVRIEGAVAKMPEMNIFCYPGQQELLEGVSITYGKEELMVSLALPFAQTEAGTNYYMLLDISASVSPEYFEGMKGSILDFWQNMGAKDKLSLITFGDAVTVVFQNQTAADDISGTVNALQNTDQTTCLFEAIDKTAKLADTKEEANVRKVAVVLTDGEDFSQNTSTKEEALTTLKEKMFPLYAMAAKENNQGTENIYLDSMGAFVRESGGVMEVFDAENAVAVMRKLHQTFAEAFVISAKARTNMVDYKKKALAVTFSDGKTKTSDFVASYYQEDEEAPVASVKQNSKHSLKITFSEPVKGANKTDAYEIKYEDSRITDGYMVRYNKEKASAVLTFEEHLLNGKYEIKFRGVTDDSMEENELTKRCAIQVKKGRKLGVSDYLEKYQAFVAGTVILTVLLIAGAIVWHRVKRQKGIVTIEGKAVLQSNVERKHHVQVLKKQIPKRQIQFFLEGAAGAGRQLTVDVSGSIIVGRSRNCDVSIEDEKMSRQHFAISDRNGTFYLEDLHTTNGTLVNGKQVAAPSPLASGDRIQAGDIAMTVRW